MVRSDGQPVDIPLSGDLEISPELERICDVVVERLKVRTVVTRMETMSDFGNVLGFDGKLDNYHPSQSTGVAQDVDCIYHCN